MLICKGIFSCILCFYTFPLNNRPRNTIKVLTEHQSTGFEVIVIVKSYNSMIILLKSELYLITCYGFQFIPQHKLNFMSTCIVVKRIITFVYNVIANRDAWSAIFHISFSINGSQITVFENLSLTIRINDRETKLLLQRCTVIHQSSTIYGWSSHLDLLAQGQCSGLTRIFVYEFRRDFCTQRRHRHLHLPICKLLALILCCLIFLCYPYSNQLMIVIGHSCAIDHFLNYIIATGQTGQCDSPVIGTIQRKLVRIGFPIIHCAFNHETDSSRTGRRLIINFINVTNVINFINVKTLANR